MKPPRGFKPEPFSWHEEITVEITSLTNLGAGLGRLDGRVIFVAFTLPGETVRARVWRNEDNCSHADLVEVLVAAPNRIEPACPHFGTCGGCQYQHLSYDDQLLWKTRQVQELLQHMAGVDFQVSAAVPSPELFGYRSKITPHFQKPRPKEELKIGFLEHNRRSRLIDLHHCPIAMDSLNEALPIVREQVKTKAKAGGYKKGATLLLRNHDDGVETDHRAPIAETVGDLTFHFLAGDFFQNNPFILPAFTDYVAKEAHRPGQRFLLDAYCGSGLFALSLARHFEQVTGIEVSESAADWARANARANDIDNAQFIAASAEELFKDVTHDPAVTSLIIDPPRKGCSEAFLTQVWAYQPSRVVYVSCNPATQMRDLKEFLANGYQLTAVQPFDLFPQTRHLECVMTLEKA